MIAHIQRGKRESLTLSYRSEKIRRPNTQKPNAKEMTNVCGFRVKRTPGPLIFSQIPKRAHLGSLASRKSEVWSNIKEKKKFFGNISWVHIVNNFSRLSVVFFFNHFNKLRHLLKFQVTVEYKKSQNFSFGNPGQLIEGPKLKNEVPLPIGK